MMMWWASIFVSAWLSLLFACSDMGASLVEISIAAGRIRVRELLDRTVSTVWRVNYLWLLLLGGLLYVVRPQATTSFVVDHCGAFFLLLVALSVRGLSWAAIELGPGDARRQRIAWATYRFGALLSGFMVAYFFAHVLVTDSSRVLPPWWAFSIGLFFCSLFAFTASILGVCEARTPSAVVQCRTVARTAGIGALVIGGMVCLAGILSDEAPFGQYRGELLLLVALFLAVGMALYFVIVGAMKRARAVMGATLAGLVVEGMVTVKPESIVRLEGGLIDLGLFAMILTAIVMLVCLVALRSHQSSREEHWE